MSTSADRSPSSESPKVGGRFFWKLFATHAVLVLLTAVVTGYLVYGRSKSSVVAGLEQSLHDECVLVTPFARSVFDDPTNPLWQNEVDALGASTGRRITLVAKDGTVLADSHQLPSKMDNHAARAEVQEAWAKGIGTSQRFSTTTGERRLYAARQLEGGRGIVRVSVALTDVEATWKLARTRIALGALVGSLVALAVGLLLTRRITTPVVEMTQKVDQWRRGDHDPIRDLPNDEVGMLGEALNHLQSEVAERIAEVSREEAQLRAMLAGMVEGVVAVDDEDRVVFSNEAARLLLRLPVNPRGPGLFGGAGPEALGELIHAARENNAASKQEFTVSSDGRDTIVRAQAHRFHSAQASGVVVVFDDVTELRHLERVRQDFVANVSHELKTPLTSIRGYVETLIDGALTDHDNNRRFLGKIDSNVQRLNHLVTDLLSLARIEAQQGVGPTEIIDCRNAVLATVRRFGEHAARKGIQCEVRSAGQQPSRARRRRVADPGARQPARQRDQVHPGRGARDRFAHARRHVRPHRGAGHGHRDPAGRPRARVRALLPRRQGPFALRGRHGPRTVHRQAPGPGDGRGRGRRQRAR